MNKLPQVPAKVTQLLKKPQQFLASRAGSFQITDNVPYSSYLKQLKQDKPTTNRGSPTLARFSQFQIIVLGVVATMVILGVSTIFYRNFGNPVDMEMRVLSAAFGHSPAAPQLKPGEKELWCGYELRIASWYKPAHLPLVCSHIVFGGIKIAGHGYSLDYHNATYNILEKLSLMARARGQKLVIEIGSRYTPLGVFKEMAKNEQMRGDLFRSFMALLRLSHAKGGVFTWLNDISNRRGAENWLLPIFTDMHTQLVTNGYICAAYIGSYFLRRLSLQPFADKHLTPVILQTDHTFQTSDRSVMCPHPYKYRFHRNLTQLWLLNTVKNGLRKETWSAFEDDVLVTWSSYGNRYKLKKSSKHAMWSPTKDGPKFVSYHTVCNHLKNKDFGTYHDQQTDCQVAFKGNDVYAITGPSSERLLSATQSTRGVFFVDPWGDSQSPPCKTSNEIAKALYKNLRSTPHAPHPKSKQH